MKKEVIIGNRRVGENQPVFLIAEMSANHLMDYERAVNILKEAKKCGADAVKLQTYTPDTITLDCSRSWFQITQGTIWDGTTLHKLYETAYTPWEWQPKLNQIAKDIGLICFSSPFDLTAVDFMEEMQMPAYKIASFEINDIPLIRKVAALGKPVIMATGIALAQDIELALRTCLEEKNEQVILLKCTSAYPSPYEEMNLSVIPDMAKRFECITGLSDHSLGTAAAVAGIALGAKVVEKHFTLSRADKGADAAFSMEPQEFRKMAEEIRIVEKAVGQVSYELSEKQKNSREHSRSLFIVKDMKKGEVFSRENIRSIRPGFGLHTIYLEEILGKKASVDIQRGTPASFSMVEGREQEKDRTGIGGLSLEESKEKAR